MGGNERTRVVFVEVKKANSLLLADCRPLVHLFSCRCLQMWSADCRPFTSSKTNSTLNSSFLDITQITTTLLLPLLHSAETTHPLPPHFQSNSSYSKHITRCIKVL
ncbi:hypothetical protein Hanom_Chr09g00768971 [Helianthus anomalus]